MEQSGTGGNGSRGLWKTLSGHFPQGKFLHNLSIIMTGTAIAQLLGLVMMPVVSRLFTPADFGIFGTFYTVVGVWGAVITLGYNQAVVLPKHKEEALNLFVVACLSVALITVLTVVFVVLFPVEVQHLLKAPSRGFLPLFFVAIVVMGLTYCLEAWCTRTSAFKSLAVSQVVRMVSAVGLWIALGFGHMGALGLVLGLVCGDFLASINLGRACKADLKEGSVFLAWSKIKELAREYRDFPLYASPRGLMIALSEGLPVILLGYFYGIGVAGAYAFGVRILQTPMNFISAPLCRVVLQRSSEIHNQDDDLFPFYIKGTVVLMAVILVPAMILFIWAPQIFSWIFGAEWREAGIYARWLILWISMIFIKLPAITCATILRQQRNLLLYQCVILFSIATILIMGGLYWTALATVIAFSVLGFMLHMLLILWIGGLLYIKRQERIKFAV
jgi:O-antigen/teichoic acid export membrane protein